MEQLFENLSWLSSEMWRRVSLLDRCRRFGETCVHLHGVTSQKIVAVRTSTLKRILWGFSRKPVDKIQVWFKKLTKLTENSHKDFHTYILWNVLLYFSENEKFSRKSSGENQITSLILNNFIFLNSRRLWDDVEKHGGAGRPQYNTGHALCVLQN